MNLNFSFVAIQKSINEWKAKKEKSLIHDEDEDIAEEENIYAVQEVSQKKKNNYKCYSNFIFVV